MTKEEFKKQRAALIAKLAWLAIEINEQGKYYANFEILGHRNMFWARIFSKNLSENLCPAFEMVTNIETDQYELIIAVLQNLYNKILEFLEV